MQLNPQASLTNESLAGFLASPSQNAAALRAKPEIQDTGFDIFRGFLWAIAFELSAAAIVVSIWFGLHAQ